MNSFSARDAMQIRVSINFPSHSVGIRRLSQGSPVRQHGDEHAVLEYKVVVDRSERVESGEPEEGIAEPVMDACNRRAGGVRNSNKRLNLHAGQERQGMPLKPRAS